MPLEIRELTIKARVESSTSNSSAQESGNGANLNDVQINRIVDKVLKILKERKDR